MPWYYKLLVTKSIMSSSRKIFAYEWFPNVTRDDAVRICNWVGRIVPLTGMDPTDADVDAENHSVSGMF